MSILSLDVGIFLGGTKPETRLQISAIQEIMVVEKAVDHVFVVSPRPVEIESGIFGGGASQRDVLAGVGSHVLRLPRDLGRI